MNLVLLNTVYPKNKQATIGIHRWRDECLGAEVAWEEAVKCVRQTDDHVEADREVRQERLEWRLGRQRVSRNAVVLQPSVEPQVCETNCSPDY